MDVTAELLGHCNSKGNTILSTQLRAIQHIISNYFLFQVLLCGIKKLRLSHHDLRNSSSENPASAIEALVLITKSSS